MSVNKLYITDIQASRWIAGRLNALSMDSPADRIETGTPAPVRFEVPGREMIEKEVKMSGHSGRVYLPPNWIGRKVKIIKLD